MVYHWLKRPRSLAIPLVILALLVIVACGPTEQPGMSGTGAAKTDAAMPAAQQPAQAMEKAAPTAVPQAAQPSPAGQFKLDRLIVAVSPLGLGQQLQLQGHHQRPTGQAVGVGVAD